MDLVYEKEDLLIDGCGKDASYNFYRHAGIGVTQPRGEGLEETPAGGCQDVDAVKHFLTSSQTALSKTV